MSSAVKYNVQNELLHQEIIKEPPMANYDEFDEHSYDQHDGGAELALLRRRVPGIDDGFIDHKPEVTNGHHNGRRIPAGYFPQWPTSYPQDPEIIENIPSLNLYQQKKSMAQGLMDLALLSANANQLRYVLEYKERNHYYYISLTLISMSLILQILVACALVFKSRYNIENEQEYANADRINNFITMGILFITIINVFTSAFGVMPGQAFVAVPYQDGTAAQSSTTEGPDILKTE